MGEKSGDFDKLLLDSIDEALLSLGEPVKQSIYYHLEKNFLKRDEIPANLENFQVGLERIFGIGARFIEILVMKNLYTKIGHPLTMNKNEKLEFIKYVTSAKTTFSQECHA